MKKIVTLSMILLLLISIVSAYEKKTDEGIRQEITKRLTNETANRITVQTILITRLQSDSNANAQAIESISRSLDDFINKLSEKNVTKDKNYHAFVVSDANFGRTIITQVKAKEQIKILGFIPITVTDIFEIDEDGNIVNTKLSGLRNLIVKRIQ